MIRVYWAEPGPQSDAALRRYWARAYEIAAEIVAREALKASEPPTQEDK